MCNTLKVIKPFYVMEPGDTFEFSHETNMYTSVYNEVYNGINTREDGNVFKSEYTSTYSISKEYANDLIKQGVLEEVCKNENENKSFINIFDKINELIVVYQTELNNINDLYNNDPECLKVERITTLSNMIKLLEYLNSLKK